jgi:hypothetical protein
MADVELVRGVVNRRGDIKFIFTAIAHKKASYKNRQKEQSNTAKPLSSRIFGTNT